MSTHDFAEQTQQLFDTLLESLEEGEELPRETLISYLRHPEVAIRELARQLLEGRSFSNLPTLKFPQTKLCAQQV